MTLRDDITAAVKESGATGFHFVRLTEYEALLDSIAERFLNRGRQDLKYVWLWEHFRERAYAFRPDDALAVLTRHLPAANRYWFLASDEHGKYWVAEATGAAILEILSAMYGFEYYIVERKLRWLVCENHHGVLIQAGEDGILPCPLPDVRTPGKGSEGTNSP